MVVAVAAAALLSAALLFGGDGDSCEEWQARYEAGLESFGIEGGATGTLQFINMGPLAGLDESKPEGCAMPG